MTSSSQNPTPLDDLRADASATVATEQDLLAWIPKAALLAALGAPQPLANFPAHLTHLALDDAKWQTLLKERLQEAAWDFRHALGEDLGHAHLDAQEWHYAYQLIPTTTDRNWSMEEVRLFEAWAEDACDHNLLDQEAQAAILNWRETWPVAEEGLLSTVRTPLTEGERWVGAELMRMQG